jgi:fibronectin-binding autotransporter adhesin
MITVFSLSVLTGLQVCAVEFLWDGGGTNAAWSTAENWEPDGAPQSADDTTVKLDGNTRPALVQDLAAPFVLNRLEFLNNGATKPAFNLSGNAIRVVTNGAIQPSFYLTRAATCTMSNPIEIPAGTSLNLQFTTYGLTLSGVISGEGAIDKQAQDGGLTLENGANSFSGGLTIRAQNKDWHKVNVQASGAMGTGLVSLYGGTLATTFQNPGGLIFHSTTVHPNPVSLFQDSPIFAGLTNDRTAVVTLNGDISLSASTLHLRGGGTGTVNGVVTGSGANAIQKSDPGTWTLSGANAFTGRVTVGGGVLKLGAAEALNPAVPLAVIGGNLDLNGFVVTNGGLTLSGGVVSNGTLYATDAISLGGGTLLAALDGPAGVTKSGAGLFVLSMPNGYQGATTVAAGTLQFAQRTALYGGDTALWTDANIAVDSGATLALNVGGSGEFTSGDLDILNILGSAAGGFKSGSAWGFDTSFAPGGAFAYDTAIVNPGGNIRGLTKLGSGTLELTGLNTYTGPTRLAGGVLSVGSIADGGLASGVGMSGAHGANLVFAGGALRYTGPSVRTDRGFRYAVNTNVYIFDVAQPDTVLTFGSLSNAVFDSSNTTIVKTGPGTLVFGKGAGATYNFPVKALHILEGRFQTETGNTVQHNLHSLASQGPALVLGDGAEMGFNNPVENYVDGGEMMIQYVGTQRGARVTAGSWLLCGPTTNAAGARLYNTHVFDVNDGADDVDLDIRGTLGIYSSIANSHVRKTGAGTLRFNSAASTFRGTTVIRGGCLLAAANVPAGGNSVLGNCTDAVVIGDAATLPADVPTFAFEGPAGSAFTFARGIVTHATGGASAFGSHSNVNVTLSGAVTVSNTLHLLSSTAGTNALFVTGGIAGPGGVTVTGGGTVLYTAANAYEGPTTVAGGTLRLGAAERIADASPLRLAGGALDLDGHGETVGPLDVVGAAVIDFGAGGCTLICADSAAETWDGALVLRNLKLGGANHFYVGAAATLSGDQLARITSPTGQKARQRATGEIILLPSGTAILLR